MRHEFGRSGSTARQAWVVAILLLAAARVDDAAAERTLSWGNPTPQGNPLRALVMVDDLVGVAVGDFGTTLRTSDGGVTWEDRTQLGTFLPDLHDLTVDGDGALLAVGSAPGVFRSTDGGASWDAVANPSSGTLRSLFRLDALTLFAAGDGGRIYRSDDDGVSWALLANLGGQEIVDQWWVDASRGYIMGPGRIRRTTNGGTNWSTIPGVAENGFFPGDIQFRGPLDGWILVDFDTYRTTDGGATWFSKHGSFANAPIYQEEASFLDATTRWVGTEAEGAEIWRTEDDGLTWTRQYQDLRIGGVTDLERLANGVLLAVTDAGDLLRSADGGASWLNFADLRGSQPRSVLEVVEARADGRIFAGGSPEWLQSDDHGRTWFVPASTPGVLAVTAIAHHGATWYVGGTPTQGQSRVSRSTDDGATWQSVALSASYTGYPAAISAPAPGVAFVATYGGSGINYVYRTTDSGASWHLRNTGLPVGERFFTIDFLDANTGYVGGGDFGSALWRTTDAGASWVSLAANGFGNDAITDMHWFDVDTGVAAGLGGAYRTTNGGVNWTLRSSGPFATLEMADDLHGYARELGAGIYETVDGGISWQFVPLPIAPYYYDIAAVPGGFVTVGQTRTIFRGAEDEPAGVPEDGPGFVDVPDPSRAGRTVVAFPNPSEGPVTLRFRAEHTGRHRVRTFDASGRLVEAWTEDVHGRGAREVEMTWSPPGAGAWFVEVVDPRGVVRTGRLVRTK